MSSHAATVRSILPFAGLALWLLVESLGVVDPVHAQAETGEAPFGDKVSERIPMYHRAWPTVGTAGALGRLGIIEAKGVGFRAILNLTTTTVAAGQNDKAMAEFAVLRYFTVPVASLPSDEQVAEIRRIVVDPANAPVLIYGHQDQAAAAWTLVRAAGGVPAEFALQEGKTAGLRQLLVPVQERLGVRTSPPRR
jgi:protein tyrosine phosphatase (PTP) superfamily phosphohydrolase (DUF442 family)